VACEVKKSVGVGIDQLAGAVDVEENLRAADYEHDGQRGQQDDAQYSPRQAVAQFRQENFLFPSEGVSQVLVVIGKRSKKQIALWHCGEWRKRECPHRSGHSLGWKPGLTCRPASPWGRSACEVLRDEVPVDDVPERFDELRTGVAVVDVVRVLPDVAGQQRLVAC